MTADAEQTADTLQQVIDTVDRIESDDPSTFDRGEDFLCDIRDKAQDMLSAIEERGTVTEKQASTADNWLAGVSKWDHS